MTTIDRMRTKDVAELADLSPLTVRRRYRRGLPPYPAAKIGRILFFDRAHVEAWLRGEIPDVPRTEPATTKPALVVATEPEGGAR